MFDRKPKKPDNRRGGCICIGRSNVALNSIVQIVNCRNLDSSSGWEWVGDGGLVQIWRLLAWTRNSVAVDVLACMDVVEFTWVVYVTNCSFCHVVQLIVVIVLLAFESSTFDEDKFLNCVVVCSTLHIIMIKLSLEILSD